MGRDNTRDVDATSIDPLEVRMGFLQKYGIKGVLVLGLSLMAPYVGSMLDNYNNKSVARAVKASVGPLESKIDKLETLWIAHDGGVKTLNAEDIDYIARMAVGKQSIYKVQEIQELLEKFPNENRSNSENNRLKQYIKNILLTNSNVYIVGLNKYQHRAIGKVGTYIAKTFPMNTFLENIYDIALNPATKEDRSMISEDIMLYMLEVQDYFFTDMYHKMKAKEHL